MLKVAEGPGKVGFKIKVELGMVVHTCDPRVKMLNHNFKPSLHREFQVCQEAIA